MAENLQTGDIIFYRLRPEQKPTNPYKKWKGQILQICEGTFWRKLCYVVVSLEPGYEGLDEIVYPEQIDCQDSEEIVPP